MNIRCVLFLLSRLHLLISAFLLIPALVSWYYHETTIVYHFLFTAGLVWATGMGLGMFCRREQDTALGVREGFLLVTLVWTTMSLLGAIPFYLSGHFPSFIDAFFETVSGFTTTGASVLADVESLPRGVLFWRDFTQWLGGMGIIVLAIAVLPQLSVGGMQLIKNEMPGPTFEQLKPRIKKTAMSLWKVYLLLSLLQVLLLYCFGMPLFEGFCHMFGTMATGGFSVRNLSIGAYETPAIQMVVAFFMFAAGMNFVLHYALIKGNLKKLFQDGEWRFYVAVVLISVGAIAMDLMIQSGKAIGDSLRLAIFQVISIVTTTGFVTDNFDAWPHLSKGILFLLMFVGGCAGSTGGGLKQLRLLLLFKRAYQAIVQHVFPRAVVTIKYNKRAVPEAILQGITSFFVIYLVIFAFVTLILLAFNIDFVSATSAVVACLSNVGPGFGQVGAIQNYAFMPGIIKLVLCACMILGRLEIFTVLVLFFPMTWRK